MRFLLTFVVLALLPAIADAGLLGRFRSRCAGGQCRVSANREPSSPVAKSKPAAAVQPRALGHGEPPPPAP